MANVIKYTGESVTATLGNFATGHHFSYSLFKATGYIPDLTSSTYRKYTSTSTGALGILPTLNNSASSYTVYISGYPVWDNGNSGNEVRAAVEIYQSTTFTSKVTSTDIWVGTNTTVSYTLTNNPYNKGVSINVSEGGISSSSNKPASNSAYTLSLTGKKSGQSTVSVIPNQTRGNASLGSHVVKVYQPITEIHVNKTSVTVNKGGSVTIKLAVSATNSNDSSATNNIHHPIIYHKFTGTATGSIATSASKTVTIGTTPGTDLTLSNITAGGDLIIAAKSGLPTEETAAIASGTLTKTIKISIGTIKFTFYSDSAYSTEKTDNAINPGDYFFVKVTNGIGESGTLSCTTGGITIDTTNISDNGGKSKVTVGSTVSSSFKIKFKPVNGSAVESTTISIKIPTITLK